MTVLRHAEALLGIQVPGSDRAALTPRQIAVRLLVSERTVLELIRSGDLPAAKVGQQWRIRPEVFEAFLRGAPIADPEPLDAADLAAIRDGVAELLAGRGIVLEPRSAP